MQIADSNINMNSSYFKQDIHYINESINNRTISKQLSNQITNQDINQINTNISTTINPNTNKQINTNAIPSIINDIKNLETTNKDQNNTEETEEAETTKSTTETEDEEENSIGAEYLWKLKLLTSVFNYFFSTKYDFSFFEKIIKLTENYSKNEDNYKELTMNNDFTKLDYNREEIAYEAEMVEFKTDGIIKTKDGQQIKIDFKLELSREFLEYNNFSITQREAQKKDPLVINYDGNFASLTDEKFAFDLDIDGIDDSISFVKYGSGFLALDINEDGIINNGAELFGAKTGDGFKELNNYDNDNNNWIDDNDPIFNRLRIWSKDTNANDYIHTLKEKNIGAIYLNKINTPFDIKNNSNELIANIKSTSIYLKESGLSAGSIQQIDLVV